MNTLYIDTHSSNVELVLYQNGKFVGMLQSSSYQNHGSIIIPLLNELLEKFHLTVHELNDIIVVNGPGSFTGIRLGITIAKMLAFTLNIPIRVMSSILIKAISNTDPGYFWFGEAEKNGYYVGKFNDLDELVSDYVYIKKDSFTDFCEERKVLVDVSLDYQRIFDFSRTLPIMNPHAVNPLYVKMIEVQK